MRTDQSDTKKLTDETEVDPANSVEINKPLNTGTSDSAAVGFGYVKLQNEDILEDSFEPLDDQVICEVDSSPLEGNNDKMGNKRSDPEQTSLTKSFDKNTRRKRSQYSAIESSTCIHGRKECNCIFKNTTVSYQAYSDSSDSEHCHADTNVGTNTAAKKKLIIASVLCLLFMVVECVGGLLANSLAIATDAAHLLTDFASFMISLFAIWISARPASQRMSYGWHRAEVIGALTSVLLIWVVTGILVYMAVERVLNDNFEIDSTYMLISAGIGVAVNVVMGCSLHFAGVPHSHSHGGGGHSHGSHQHKEVDVEQGHHHDQHHANSNINVRAALIHVIGDFLQSIGVFIAALVVHFWPNYRIVDPICTFIFSVLVLVTTVAILKETIVVLMEGKPKGIDFAEVRELLTQIRGVKHVHNLRIWALTMEKTVLSTHVGIEAGIGDYHRVQKECVRRLREKYSFFEITVQVEEWNPNMEDCVKCNDISD